MNGKLRQVWLPVGLGVVVGGLLVALALGVLTEAVILLATAVVCGLSLIPLLVDRRIRRSPDGRAAIIPAGRWGRRQGA